LRGDYPWELNPAMAHYASVSLTFEETGEDVYSFDDIRQGEDLASSSSLERNASGGTVEVSTRVDLVRSAEGQRLINP